MLFQKIKRFRFFIAIGFTSLMLTACTTQQIQQTVGTILGGVSADPTEGETAQGLKEALIMGIINGTGLLSKEDGFFKNDLVKIPWPQEADFVANALQKVGAGGLVDKVTMSLNRAAEKASGEAKEVFVTAIKQMTIQDAMNILFGGEGQATAYLKKTTTPLLTEKFRPIIDNALSTTNATKFWGDATTTYNKIPFVKPVNTDLSGFVTQKALDGVFLMVEKEENKIRQDPFARTTDLLKKVFGFADKKKSTQGQ